MLSIFYLVIILLWSPLLFQSGFGSSLTDGQVNEQIQNVEVKARVILPDFRMPNTRGQYSFEKVPVDEPERFSSSHCYGSSEQFDAWRVRACHYRDLCFNTSSKDFLFYGRDTDDLPDPISIGTFNYVGSMSFHFENWLLT